MRVTESRIALGGGAHGKRFNVLHGSTMRYAPSGDTYRKHDLHWWVPSDDSDAEARARVTEYKSKR